MFKGTRDQRVKKRGSVYWCVMSKNTVRVRQSLFTRNYEIALGLTNEIEKMILLGEDYTKLFERAKEDKLIEDLWPLFIKDKTDGTKKIKRVRPKTLKEYNGFWTRYYEDFFGGMRIEDIDEGVWDEYLEHVRTVSRSKRDVKILNHWKYLSAFATWARVTGRTNKIPDIYNPDEEPEDGIGKNYSDQELFLFRKYSSGPAKLWIFMAQYMGMRSSEITQLRKERIDRTAKIIRLKKVDTKTKQARKFGIHKEVWPLLEAQYSAHTGSPFLFPNVRDKHRPMDKTGFKRPWNAIRNRLGIEGRFHDFRHSFATRAFANPNLNPVIICESLGMSMATARKYYLHFTDEQFSAVTNSFVLLDSHITDTKHVFHEEEKRVSI